MGNYKNKILIAGAILSLGVILALPWLQSNFISYKNSVKDTSAAECICGDGNWNVFCGEECDDGNTIDGDGCSSVCLIEAVCGDGILHSDKGEYCDDGNTTGGDGCSATCSPEPVGCYFSFDELPLMAKGNATDEICAQQCTDTEEGFGAFGYTGGYAASNISCVCVGQDAATCEDPSEGICNIGTFDEFTNVVCGYTTCGNSTVDTGEGCDDGNLIDGDGCSARCQTETCGNNVLNTGEDCDDGNTAGGDGCSSTCVTEYNGCYINYSQITSQLSCDSFCNARDFTENSYFSDNGSCLCDGYIGFTTAEEECALYCSDNPSAEICGYIDCGNGLVEAGEECDGAGAYTTCDAYCQRVPVCNDGFIDSPEQCEDGNTEDGDGCDSSCQFEGTLYTQADGATINECYNFDGAEPSICLWRDVVNTYVNDKVGNDNPFEPNTYTGNLEWYYGACSSVTAESEPYGVLRDLVFDILLLVQNVEPLNKFASLFIHDTFAAEPPYDLTGETMCLKVNDSKNYYNISWASYSTTDAAFSFVWSEYTGTCGDGVNEVVEQCDDGNTENGDGCSSTCTVEGTTFTHTAGSQTYDEIHSTVQIYRTTTLGPTYINNKVGNPDPFDDRLDTGAVKWYGDSCDKGGEKPYALFGDMLNFEYRPKLIQAPVEKKNWFVNLFTNDAHAAPIPIPLGAPSQIEGKFSCLQIVATGEYYNIYWTGYSNLDDSFSYVRAPYTNTCGDGLKEIPEQCDDGNTTDGDDCDSSCMIEGTTYTHDDGESILECDDFDGEEPTVCLWRDLVGSVNNTVGNKDPYEPSVDTGAIEWFAGQCSAPTSKPYPMLFGLIRYEFSELAYLKPLNKFFALFVNDAHAASFTDITGRNTCLHVIDSNNYYDVFWLSYGNNFNDDDNFSYIRTPFAGVCGDNNRSADEQCDDGNILNGDGCSSVCKKEGAVFFNYDGGGLNANEPLLGDLLVSGSVNIFRDGVNDGTGVYNSYDGSNFNDAMLSSSIEWAKGLCASPTTSFYDDLRTEQIGTRNLVGENTCLHLKNNDIYYDVLWKGYEAGLEDDGGFSYYRWLYDTQAPNTVNIESGQFRSGLLALNMNKTPEDKGGGKLTRCVVKYSDSDITTENDWNNATKIYDKVNPNDDCLSGGGIKIYPPLDGAYYYSVRVYDNSGNISNIGVSSGALTAPSRPTVTDATPATGANNAPVAVALAGTNFDPIKGDKIRLIGDSGAYSGIAAVTNSAESLTFTVPAGVAPGDYYGSVVNQYGFSAPFTYTATEAEDPLPVALKIYPSSGLVGSNVDITIKGENFTGATALGLSNKKHPLVPITNFTVVNDNVITATIPASSLSIDYAYSTIITTANGTNVYSPPFYKPYVDVNITPADANSQYIDYDSGQNADFSGFSGESDTQLVQDVILRNIGSQVANKEAIVTGISTTITAGTKITDKDGAKYTGKITPPRVVAEEEVLSERVRAKLGTKAVVIEMGNPTEKINFDTDFVVTVDISTPNKPIIWYYNRAEDKFELAGKEGFKDGVHFYPGGIELASTPIDEGTLWTMGFLTDHMSAYVAGLPPVIDGITPSSGSAGTSITITGTNFHTNATVTIGGTLASSSYVDTEHLTATVPSLSAGAQSVVVENPDLLSATSSFTITSSGGSTITTTPVYTGTGGGGLSGGKAIVPTREQLLKMSDIEDKEETIEEDLRPAATTTPTAPVARVVNKVKVAFKDIAQHWAQTYIIQLYNDNVISGKSEGYFAPDDPVTRAELIKIALNSFLYNVPNAVETKPFNDVQVTDWFAPYAQVAKENKIFTGFGGDMRPNQQITRAEALKILLDASRLSLTTTTNKTYSDTNPQSWYMKYVRYAYEKGIATGYADGTFGPGDNVTRAQSAKMTVKIVDLVLDR